MGRQYERTVRGVNSGGGDLSAPSQGVDWRRFVQIIRTNGHDVFDGVVYGALIEDTQT